MPVSKERAREIAERHTTGSSPEELAPRLAPTSPEVKPLPPRVPGARAWDADARRERIAFLEDRGPELPALAGRAPEPDPASLRGNIEQYIGMTQVPTGVIGPVRVNGLHVNDDVYVPLATSEGALVASYDRGARLMTQAGGATCLATIEQVQRAPGFVFETVAGAMHFAMWAVGEVERFREIVAAKSRHARLIDVMPHLEGNHAYLILQYHTGDAAGQNMVTLCTAAVCEEIVARSPAAPDHWFVEANMSGDKKATSLSFLQTRGRNVSAEVRLRRELVEKALRTTPERMCDYWRMSFIGGVQTGSIGVSGHIANGIAALYLATGQDVACVSEAAVGVTRMETTEDGGLYCSLTLPNLILGTVGGGTRLPTARECLRILGCEGEGGGPKLAEIAAAVCLGGELSIVGALCAGEFTRAHERFGRPATSGDEDAGPRPASGESGRAADANGTEDVDTTEPADTPDADDAVARPR